MFLVQGLVNGNSCNFGVKIFVVACIRRRVIRNGKIGNFHSRYCMTTSWRDVMSFMAAWQRAFVDFFLVLLKVNVVFDICTGHVT